MFTTFSFRFIKFDSLLLFLFQLLVGEVFALNCLVHVHCIVCSHQGRVFVNTKFIAVLWSSCLAYLSNQPISHLQFNIKFFLANSFTCNLEFPVVSNLQLTG